MWAPSIAPVPPVSVVVPAFNEAENIAPLLRRLGAALPAGAEVIVVDDSTDETPEIVAAFADALPFRLVLIHRDAPTGGLGGAVVEGLRAAAAEWAVVMDADLQHPPHVVPELLARTEGHDLVVATRYAPGGSGDGLGSRYRHAVSRGAKRFAVGLLGDPVARMTDPLSGFFAVRVAALDLDRVDPVGYKILLELAVRCGLTRIAEVPFTFAPRHAGASKSTVREGLRFLRHLAMLRTAGSRRVLRPATAPVGPHADDESLKILIVTSEAPPIVSGISRSVDRVTTGLRDRGHRVDVLSSVQIPRLVLGEYRFSALLVHWRRISRMLAEYDVVNLHGPVPTMSDVVLLLAGARRSVPIVYTHHSALAVRGAETLSAVYNRLHRFLSGRADAIITSSEAYAEDQRRPEGPPVETIPWGVDVRPLPQRPTDAEPSERPLRVLFVGQMRPYKGLDWLVPAVAGRAGLELTLIGDGPGRGDYERLAGGAANVVFTGRVDDRELAAAFDTHDVVVLCSVTQAEAFGLVVLEGMAAGCVPVVTDLPGVRDLVANTGIVVPLRDSAALRAAFDGLADDRARLRCLARRARRRAEGLSWDACVERYEHVFAAAAVRSTAPRATVSPIAGTRTPGSRTASSRTAGTPIARSAAAPVALASYR